MKKILRGAIPGIPKKQTSGMKPGTPYRYVAVCRLISTPGLFLQQTVEDRLIIDAVLLSILNGNHKQL